MSVTTAWAKPAPAPRDERENLSWWRARPVVAFVVRAAIFLVPIAASIATAYVLARVWRRPDGTWPSIGWWIVLVAVGGLAMRASDRIARRFLPLSMLLRMSLVFPDEKPSRFGVALRSGTTRQLRQRVDDIAEHGLTGGERSAAEQLLELVAALRVHDRFTRGHGERVRAYAALIGEELGLDEVDRSKLQWAGLIHDVGKLAVPDEILNKPGRLTDEEFDVIKTHPAEGMRLAGPLAPWLGEWILAVGEHHERWDGTGYPNRLAGTEISLAGRIVAVADVFDVITAARSYKRPQSPHSAREELARHAGSQFDPEIVRAFLAISIGRLRTVMWPLSWLAHVPYLGWWVTAPATSWIAPAVVAVGTAVTGGAVADHQAPPDPPAIDAPAEPADGAADPSLGLRGGAPAVPTRLPTSGGATEQTGTRTTGALPTSGTAADRSAADRSAATSTTTPPVARTTLPARDGDPDRVATGSPAWSRLDPAAAGPDEVTTTTAADRTPAPTTSPTSPTSPTATTVPSTTMPSVVTLPPTTLPSVTIAPTTTPDVTVPNPVVTVPAVTIPPTTLPVVTTLPAIPTTIPAIPAIPAIPTTTELPTPCELLRRGETGLAGSDLSGCSVAGIDLDGVDLSFADLTGADLSGATVEDFSLEGANLTGADLIGTRFRDGGFGDVDGARLVARAARFERVDLGGADLSGSDLRSARFVDASFGGADLTGADLADAVASGVDFHAADLDGANLSRAELDRSEMLGTSAVGARFVDASLRDAGLDGADLTSASLRDADLRDSVLGGTDLDRADLRGADLTGATDSPLSIVGTIFSLATTCPNGLPAIVACW